MTDTTRTLAADETDLLARRFKLLADPTRLRVVYALLEYGDLNVGRIAELIGITESATSHQLRLLRDGNVVKAERNGREMHYRVADLHVRVILDLAVEHYLHGHETHAGGER